MTEKQWNQLTFSCPTDRLIEKIPAMSFSWWCVHLIRISIKNWLESNRFSKIQFCFAQTVWVYYACMHGLPLHYNFGSWWWTSKYLQFIMEPMVLSVVYVWCRLNPDEIVDFWFGLQFKAIYLPWVFAAFEWLLSGR